MNPSAPAKTAHAALDSILTDLNIVIQGLDDVIRSHGARFKLALRLQGIGKEILEIQHDIQANLAINAATVRLKIPPGLSAFKKKEFIQQTVYTYLMTGGQQTTKQIAEELSYSQQSIVNAMRSLEERGMVARTGSIPKNGAALWAVIDEWRPPARPPSVHRWREEKKKRRAAAQRPQEIQQQRDTATAMTNASAKPSAQSKFAKVELSAADLQYHAFYRLPRAQRKAILAAGQAPDCVTRWIA